MFSFILVVLPVPSPTHSSVPKDMMKRITSCLLYITHHPHCQCLYYKPPTSLLSNISFLPFTKIMIVQGAVNFILYLLHFQLSEYFCINSDNFTHWLDIPSCLVFLLPKILLALKCRLASQHHLLIFILLPQLNILLTSWQSLCDLEWKIQKLSWI